MLTNWECAAETSTRPGVHMGGLAHCFLLGFLVQLDERAECVLLIKTVAVPLSKLSQEVPAASAQVALQTPDASVRARPV